MKKIRNALGTIVVLVLSIIQVAEAKPKEKFDRALGIFLHEAGIADHIRSEHGGQALL